MSHNRALFSIAILLLFTLISGSSNSFKENQLSFPKVSNAYKEKYQNITHNLKEHGIQIQYLEVYLRAFKLEKKIELWAKNSGDKEFQKVADYPICRLSGTLGPKRRQGDFQVPEGFYYINIFNPNSKYHLSLGINYPNASDRILGYRSNLGGDIFIHGRCVTIGCLPITDDKIRELYVYCVEARNNGQMKIPITIYPAELEGKNMVFLQNEFSEKQEVLDLYKDLKEEFDFFNTKKILPKITFLPNGRHSIRE
jgi:murein L,D-transpeptidase YafK